MEKESVHEKHERHENILYAACWLYFVFFVDKFLQGGKTSESGAHHLRRR